MRQPLLSILIPITPDRLHYLKSLTRKFGYYLFDLGLEYRHNPSWAISYSEESFPDIEMIIMCDNREMTIGEKREILYKKANGLYSFQIDSDDDISEDAIKLILKAIKENPQVDCITFRERCDMNGQIKTSNHSIGYEKWMDNFDGFDYVRCPFYKDVIRTDIAQSVPFPQIRYNEDEQWSMALRPHLKTEYHIDKEIYYYNYYPKESHEERYGLNRHT